MASAGLRSAEKGRVSTCELADRVAQEVLGALEGRDGRAAPLEGGAAALLQGGQAVLAGFVLSLPPDDPAAPAELRAVALGAGTKFMADAAILKDRRGETVRDCHAEVLARRGLKLFLLRELRNAATGAGSDVLALNPASGLYRLRPGVTLHMYSSSQPCGNCTLKRWAKGRKETFRPELGPGAWPPEPHGKLCVMARGEGQVALLVKREGPEAGRVDDEDGGEGVSCGRGGVLAPGTARPGSGEGCTMTCSDKIASWNALGVQGALLALAMEPIYLASVTVGRKFSRAHCERGLCCRLQDFAPRKVPALAALDPFQIRHPSMMCTAIKLDHGVYKGEGARASFDSRCLVWARGDERAELLEGASGLARGEGAAGRQLSRVCKARLFGAFKELVSALKHRPELEALAGGTYRAAKDGAAAYQAAKALLQGSPNLFAGWVKAPAALEAFR